MEKAFFYARVSDPERLEFWKDALGLDTVPVKSPNPVKARLPGVGEALVYMLDPNPLTQQQQERLVMMLAKKFGLDEREAWDEFARGVPILAADVWIVIPGRLV